MSNILTDKGGIQLHKTFVFRACIPHNWQIFHTIIYLKITYCSIKITEFLIKFIMMSGIYDPKSKNMKCLRKNRTKSIYSYKNFKITKMKNKLLWNKYCWKIYQIFMRNYFTLTYNIGDTERAKTKKYVLILTNSITLQQS